MGVVARPVLVGREVELADLERSVASLADGPAAVLICGGAGIGKTSLWREAATHAEGAGVRVLNSRCVEVEMPIAFGALSDLLEGAFDEFVEGLSGAQRRALLSAFGRGDEGEEREDWLALATAVLAAVRTLVARGPLLLALDDVQWLDPGSRRVLTWALRRVGGAPIGVLATLRDETPERDPFALSDVLSPERFLTLDLAPLSAGALQHLIAARTGQHLPRPTLTRLQRASGGNPLFAIEYARAVADGAEARRPTPLEVPASLEELIRARVETLPKRLRPLLEVAAALERPTLSLLERALADAATESLVETAVRAGVLTIDEDGRVRFTHPLLAAAVYFGTASRRRRVLHGRLTELVDSLEERGRHAALAAVGPDRVTAAFVEEAAAVAAARAALDLAAELADESVRLTPAEDEGARRRRALAAAGWLVESGEFAAARTRLAGLLASDLPATERSEALLLRAECELSHRPMLVALLRQAEVAAPWARQRWPALIRLAHHEGWVSGDTALAADRAREALAVGRALDDAPLVDWSLAALRFYEAARGFDDEPAPLDLGPAARPPRMPWWQLSPAVSRGCRLMWAGEFGQARIALAEEYASQDDAGRHANAGFVLCWLSELEWRLGDWLSAERYAANATERLGDVNPTAFPRALLAASTGRVDDAHAIAEGVLTWAARNEERVAPPRFHWLLGLLELSRGDARRAHASLAEAQVLLAAAGIREPGYLPLLPDLVESLIALDRLDEAEAALDELGALADESGHRWATPAAQRARAHLLLARRDGESAAVLATTAADSFALLPAPFDRGRALLVAGSALRRLGERRRAVEPLTEAVEIFASLGASLWLQQTEQELRRASPRPRTDRDELTAAELRVATLVAAGRKNKEVAAELYTTVATVEAHLTRIYRKLGIRSRSELARRAADGALRAHNEH